MVYVFATQWIYNVSQKPYVWNVPYERIELVFGIEASFDQSNSLLQELHWLPVEQRITYKLAVLTYETRQTSVPEYLSRHITTRSSTRTLRSSSAPLLHVPFRRTSFGKLSFSTAAPSVWNSLPVSVHNCDTLTLFKCRIKAHLFSSVYASYLSCSPAPLKPRQYGALQILYCIVLYVF